MNRHRVIGLAFAGWIAVSIPLVWVMATAPFLEAFTASCFIAILGLCVGFLGEALA